MDAIATANTTAAIVPNSGTLNVPIISISSDLYNSLNDRVTPVPLNNKESCVCNSLDHSYGQSLFLPTTVLEVSFKTLFLLQFALPLCVPINLGK